MRRTIFGMLAAAASIALPHPTARGQGANAQPKPAAKVEVLGQVQGDDSVTVYFKRVDGALDYWAYDARYPNERKACGQDTSAYLPPAVGGTLPYEAALFLPGDVRSIRLNGVRAGCKAVVQALDGLAPYESLLDCMMHEGTDKGDHVCIINGQGDPGVWPHVIATSDPYPVAYKRHKARPGGFFENFRFNAPWVRTGYNPHDKDAWFESTGEYVQWATRGNLKSGTKWTLTFYGADPNGSMPLQDHQHMMWRLEDAGHVTNASAVLSLASRSFVVPNAGSGKRLHISVEWTPTATSRRWFDVVLTRHGDRITNAGKLDTPPYTSPTVSGDYMRWELQSNKMTAQVFRAGAPQEVLDLGWGPDGRYWREVARLFWDNYSLMGSGNMMDADKPATFEWLLDSENMEFRITDWLGRRLNTAHRRLDRPVPYDVVDLGFVHQLYHTSNEVQDLVPLRGRARLYALLMQGFDIPHLDNVEVWTEAAPAPPAG